MAYGLPSLSRTTPFGRGVDCDALLKMFAACLVWVFSDELDGSSRRLGILIESKEFAVPFRWVFSSDANS